MKNNNRLIGDNMLHLISRPEASGGECSTFSPIPTNLTGVEVLSMEKKICKIDGCNNKHIAKGFCSMHYLRNKRHSDPLYEHTYPVKKCKVDKCENKYYAKGYCNKHYVRNKKYGNPLFVGIELHGMVKSLEYKTWHRMKNRCFNKSFQHYNRYGGRGITVCDKWKNSFIAFYEDMGKRPFPKAQIDRIDNDGNYEPGNCRWVTPTENVRNRSCTKMNWFMVRSLRELSAKKLFSLKELGLIYNITGSQAGNIVNSISWKELS
ncbi:hypothetical protein KA005_81945 [bacterium]|nr:hypothetical protein [bacterium]